MFWKKKKKDLTTDTAAEKPSISKTSSTPKFTNLDLRRAILDWRDFHVESVEARLRERIPSLFHELDIQIEKMALIDLFRQRAFGEKHIAPVYERWIESEMNRFGEEAQKSLSALFEYRFSIEGAGGSFEQTEIGNPLGQATIAAASAGAGILIAPTFASLSVVSAGGIMGFLGATTIALPVVAVGIVTVGGLLAFGGFTAVNIKAKAVNKYREKTRDAIRNQVLGHSCAQASVRQNMQNAIESSATAVLKELDKC